MGAERWYRDTHGEGEDGPRDAGVVTRRIVGLDFRPVAKGLLHRFHARPKGVCYRPKPWTHKH